MGSWPSGFAETLLQASDYRGFLKEFFEPGSRTPALFTYAGFARKAGFSSRAYPRDVVQGKRRITPASLPRFIRGLGLKEGWRDYFRLLVGIEENDARLSQAELERMKSKIDVLRRRLLQREHRTTHQQDPELADQVLSVTGLPDVFAALGTPERGASIAEVLGRTGLKEAAATTALEQLERIGWVERSADGRYRSRETHVSLSGVATSRIFRQFLIQGIDRARREALLGADSPDRLFHSSTICVRRDSLPRLKEDLRELVLRFADATHDAEGDSVSHLIVAFY